MRNYGSAVSLAAHCASQMEGRSFCLVMGHPIIKESGRTTSSRATHLDFLLAPRGNLPCWGELRRYQDSHEECTQPKNKRPHDLFEPFPEGIPFAVSIGLAPNWGHNRTVTAEILTRVLHEGPWGTNLLQDDVTITDTTITFSAKDGSPKSKGLKLDSTVLVSFLAFCGMITPWFTEILQHLPIHEAIASQMNQAGSPKYGPATNPYYFSRISPRRIMEKNPRLLSEGSFGTLHDYNRTRLQDVFSADEGNPCLNPKEALSGLFSREGMVYKGPQTAEEWSKVFSEYFNKILQEELAQAVKEKEAA